MVSPSANTEINVSIFVYQNNCKVLSTPAPSLELVIRNPHYDYSRYSNTHLNLHVICNNFEWQPLLSLFLQCTRTIASPNWLTICFNSFRDSFTSILLTRGSAWRIEGVTERLIDSFAWETLD